MTDTVLFLCPHGAAKSVLAAALFQRLAEERRLPLGAVCAGTEPDPEIAPHIRALIVQEGLTLPLEQPQLVTEELIAGAFHVISLGCARDTLPVGLTRWEEWDDVPPPSQNLPGAYTLLKRHLSEWMATFSTRQPNT
jgi:arsenate reductase (thioredoxin)